MENNWVTETFDRIKQFEPFDDHLVVWLDDEKFIMLGNIHVKIWEGFHDLFGNPDVILVRHYNYGFTLQAKKDHWYRNEDMESIIDSPQKFKEFVKGYIHVLEQKRCNQIAEFTSFIDLKIEESK